MLKDIGDSIGIASVIIILFILIKKRFKSINYVKANDGIPYMVYPSNDQTEKANLLSELINNLFRLKSHLVEKHLNSANSKDNWSKYVAQLNENFNETKTSIYETDPSSNLTSYSVNKGDELAFCLRCKETNKLHDINTLMYVGIHEISHIACPEVGHGDLFKEIFKHFCLEGVNIGVYKDQDYSVNPIRYCGMNLNSSILH